MDNTKSQQYWERELEHFAKAYEVNFTHFMGVFYFWIGVLSFPATAGLLAKETILTPVMFSALFLALAVLGTFLATKMYDIRCSQLRYTLFMNEARHHLYTEAKPGLPQSYKPPFDINTDLRRVALSDFGMAMAVFMSLVHGYYVAVSFFVLEAAAWKAIGASIIFISSGICLYVHFVRRKIPAPRPTQTSGENSHLEK